jgi:hypothetical protein
MTKRIVPVLAGFMVAAALAGGIVGAWLILDEDSSGAERGASIDEIVGAPGEWAGERVEVSGRVVSVYPTAFTIGTRGAELLVVVGDRAGGEHPVGPGDIGTRLGVRGVVERFDEQTELVPGEENEPRQGDAVMRADAIRRPVRGASDARLRGSPRRGLG